MTESENIQYKINNRHIKSSYIIKTILSFLNEKQKLNMIIYNTELQKKCLVDIEDYKKISGKYRKDGKNGKNGKVREYIINTDKLRFEGEYLNGKRNGKGKEYYNNGKLEFEGEYLNGRRDGKGKEYYNDGKLRFEGNYLNGKKWNGKGYNIIGKIEYEIKNGKGDIKEYNYTGGLKFEGEYLNGKRNGKEYSDFSDDFGDLFG